LVDRNPILIWEEVMPTLVGFGTFAALPDEQITERISRRILSGDQGMIVWWSIGADVHVEPHSHANEQIAWMLKGKMEFRLGSEQRVCGPGEVVVIPGGTEHEAWFREDTEVIDFFAPPRDDFTRRQTQLHERRLNHRAKAEVRWHRSSVSSACTGRPSSVLLTRTTPTFCRLLTRCLPGSSLALEQLS
jgi:quercetin dioxygenase-like cupin family protein